MIVIIIILILVFVFINYMCRLEDQLKENNSLLKAISEDLKKKSE